MARAQSGGLLTVNVCLPAEFHKKEKWYVAICPILDIVTQGETKSIARKNLIDAIQGFIITCYEMGTLDEVMKQAGFQNAIAEKKCQPPKESVKLSIPFFTNNSIFQRPCLA